MPSKSRPARFYLFALAGALCAFFLALLGVTLWAKLRGDGASPLERLVMHGLPLQIVVPCVLLLLFAAWKPAGMNWNDCLVWRTKTPWSWPAFFGYWVMMLISALFASNVVKAFYKIHWHEDAAPQPTLGVLKELADASPWMVVACVALVVVLAPLAEELLFRLTLFQSLNLAFSPLSSAVLTAVLFAAVHFHGPSALPIFVISLYCQYLRRVFGLSASILAHALFNALQFSLLFCDGTSCFN